MSKFRRKPLVVEAELYRKGLEDGFDGCGRCPTFKWENGLDDCSKCGSGRPFIVRHRKTPTFTYGDARWQILQFDYNMLDDIDISIQNVI